MARELRGIAGAAMGDTLENWHRNTLDRHFERDAVQRYRYAARSQRHINRKRRRNGEALPLVFTGDLKRQVTRIAEIRPLKTKADAILKMKGPAYVHMRQSPKHKHHLADELTRVTKGEADAMARKVDEKMTRDLNNLKQTRRYAANR